MKGDFPNYEDCKFYDPVDDDEPCEILIDGKPLDDDMDDDEIRDYLLKNSPDLSKFQFEKWDDELTKWVNQTIKSIRDGSTTEQISAGLTRESVDDSGSVSASVQDDLDDMEDKPKPKRTRRKAKVQVVEDDDEDTFGSEVDVSDIDMDDIDV